MIHIHLPAMVDEGAKTGAFALIWHYANVESNAIIGENYNLGQNANVGNSTVVGDGCRFGNSVSVFSHVELVDFVFCAPLMVFTHIAFPRAAVSRRSVFKKTIVGRGTTLCANATAVQALRVGEGTFLAAGSILTKDIKAWSMMLGVPARQVGWVGAYGDKIALPLPGEGEWVCPQTHDTYTLAGDSMTRKAGPQDILQYHSAARVERMSAR